MKHMAVQKLDIKNQLLTRARALGNSNRGIKEVCSDLINQMGTDHKTHERIAEGTFLATMTIKRMATLKDCDTGEPYRPNADTCERILRYFGAEMHFDQVAISTRYQNKPKTDL